jgi:hypothetical protein
MAETKRVSDEYNIIAPVINIGNSSSSVTIDGNLTVVGTTTSVETSNTDIADNVIVLNKGEAGAGVTLGTAGIQVDRGSSPDVLLRWNESLSYWELTTDGSSFVEIATGSGVTPGGSNTSVQFNNSGSFGGDSNLTYNGANLNIGDTTVNSGSISTNANNTDLEIFANGSGTIFTKSIIKMENEVGDPSGIAGTNQFYAKTPSSGGTGLYFANATASGELVSKTKAIVFGIIF